MLSICLNRMWNVFKEKSIHSTYERRGEEAHNKTSENLNVFFYYYYFVPRKYVRLENLKGLSRRSKLQWIWRGWASRITVAGGSNRSITCQRKTGLATDNWPVTKFGITKFNYCSITQSLWWSIIIIFGKFKRLLLETIWHFSIKDAYKHNIA